MPHADDPSIADQELLLRRVPPQWILPDPHDPARFVVSSAAFDHLEMSIDLASVRLEHGEPLTTSLVGYPGYGLVAVTARDARDRGQMVCRDPLPENHAHGLVVGKKTSSVKNHLKRQATWIELPAP